MNGAESARCKKLAHACQTTAPNTIASDMIPVFFFFQAEDGIRDSSVTGVQTCALPISEEPEPLASEGEACCTEFCAASFSFGCQRFRLFSLFEAPRFLGSKADCREGEIGRASCRERV